MQARTSTINTVRRLLRELGVLIPVGTRNVVPATHGYIGDAESNCPEVLRPVLLGRCEEIRALEESIRRTERQLETLAKQIPVVARLRTIRGTPA